MLAAGDCSSCGWNLKSADIARSVRLNEEVTRVSQHFGALTIRSADAFVKEISR
ncbi:cullin-3A [Dorcoceras hygrometricum]|uniref:Cullin-3A n=1 Tax=Dorcoceras hygrometricum TaxID=472368 RepID=A0A2Z7CT84_9LAMI|nr:cullin-3A [Dorcoceras hygrometricum]